jgi:hypothetical protein
MYHQVSETRASIEVHGVEDLSLDQIILHSHAVKICRTPDFSGKGIKAVDGMHSYREAMIDTLMMMMIETELLDAKTQHVSAR